MILRIVFSMLATLWAAQALAEPASRPVDDWFKEQYASGAIAAAAVAYIDGKHIATHGVGHHSDRDDGTPGADAQFQIGSITKVFTNLLLAELVASGEVGYDTMLGDRLPNAVKPRNPDVARIALLTLATHRSGLPRLPANLDLGNTDDPYASFDVSKLHEAVKISRDKQPLGSFYAYSNFGAGLLGHVLGVVQGEGYRAALSQRVLAPLGLRHVAFQPGKNAMQASSDGKRVTAWTFDALAGAGALWASVEDLARLTQAYLGTHEHTLAHDLAKDLEIVAPAGNFEVTRVWHVARAGKEPVYWHNGGTSGFHSFVGFRRDTKQGIAILVSGDADPTNIGLVSLGVTPPEPPSAQSDAGVFGQYALTPQFGIGVFERDGVLQAQATGQPAFALQAVGENWYAFGDVDASLHILRKDGKAVALELAQNGVLQRAQRVAEVATVATRNEIAVDPAALRDYAGEYAFAPGVMLTVRLAGKTLEAQLTGQPFFPVFARSADRFFYKVVDAELAFERSEGGKVEAVVLHQSGVEQRATRQP